MKWHERIPFFYGWVIVATSFACLAVGYTIWMSFSVFYVAILEEFGWSRAATAAIFSVFTIVYGFSCVASGRLLDRFGPRLMLPLGAVVAGIGLALTTRLSTLWEFYLFFGVVAVGLSGFGMVPNFTLVNSWFVKKRGAAAGWAAAGIGVGVLLFVPFLQTVIASRGWRAAYLVLAVAVVLVVPVLSFAFHRHRPQDLGLLPDGEREAPQSTQASRQGLSSDALIVDREWAAREWSLGSAARTGRFWMTLVARFLEMAVLNLFIAHQVALLVDAGYDRLLAASAVGLFGIVGSGAQVLWGVVSDRIGREASFSWSFVVGTVAGIIVLLVHPDSPVWLPYVYGIIYGLYWGAASVLMPALSADIFQGRRFGSIMGGLYVGGGLGSAAGAFLGGYVFDLTHSYTLAFALAIPAMWLCALLYWLAAPRKVRVVSGSARRMDAKTEPEDALEGFGTGQLDS